MSAAGFKAVITAGGTKEPIDPVRYIGNRSSGIMGVSLLAEALRRKFDCVLIHSELSVPLPPGRYRRIRADTAEEMRKAVMAAISPAAILVMAAAVADFRSTQTEAQKIKKSRNPGGMTLRLVPTRDILGEVRNSARRPRLTVMFSAETRGLMKNSLSKMRSKDADILIANPVDRRDSGFGSPYNRAVIVRKDGRRKATGRITKTRLAELVWDTVEDSLR